MRAKKHLALQWELGFQAEPMRLVGESVGESVDDRADEKGGPLPVDDDAAERAEFAFWRKGGYEGGAAVPARQAGPVSGAVADWAAFAVRCEETRARARQGRGSR